MDPLGFIRDILHWDPWFGPAPDQPGQGEVVEAYRQVLTAYDERRAYEHGAAGPFTCYTPGERIAYTLHLETGHTVGKTRLAAGLMLHFFTCYVPSIIYTFAPTGLQIKDLLWKEVRMQHRGAKLPGRLYDGECRLRMADDWFAIGRATTDAGGKGTERLQGQHAPHLMFILDEAEGVADYVYDAVDAMSSGGLVVALMLANPRTRTSRFHKAKGYPTTRSFHISCLWHPNVTQAREVVPGGVTRDYVEDMLVKHCEVVSEESEEQGTFRVPWHPEVIYRPRSEFLWRVKGEAPEYSSDDTLIPVGLYQQATERKEPSGAFDLSKARVGVDCARWGNDNGTAYMNHAGTIRRIGVYAQKSTIEVAQAIKARLRVLHEQHPEVTSVHVRVDGGGGYGGGIVDHLVADTELREWFADFAVLEVDFGGAAFDQKAFANTVTELYAETAEVLRGGVCIRSAPAALEADLTERRYIWKLLHGVAVKALVSKDKFRDEHDRSPDDGDGFILAAAPDHVFGSGVFIR